jgi:hypothetical protein
MDEFYLWAFVIRLKYIRRFEAASVSIFRWKEILLIDSGFSVPLLQNGRRATTETSYKFLSEMFSHDDTKRWSQTFKT